MSAADVMVSCPRPGCIYGIDEAHEHPPSLVETKVGGGLLRWAPADLEKPRSLTLKEKVALAEHDRLLTLQAEQRSKLCWQCGKLQAQRWVREVCFDFKGAKAAPVQHAQISSADYPGPVPGFCGICWDAPRALAEAVYFDRIEIQWGAVPSRWWVVFTDGLISGGDVDRINPGEIRPRITVEAVA